MLQPPPRRRGEGSYELGSEAARQRGSEAARQRGSEAARASSEAARQLLPARGLSAASGARMSRTARKALRRDPSAGHPVDSCRRPSICLHRPHSRRSASRAPQHPYSRPHPAAAAAIVAILMLGRLRGTAADTAADGHAQHDTARPRWAPRGPPEIFVYYVLLF